MHSRKPRQRHEVSMAIQAALLGAAALLAFACSGTPGPAGEPPTPAVCPDGGMELVVTSDIARRVRVLELSPTQADRVLGELPGRGTRSFDIQNIAGMVYSVHVVDTGEIVAAEDAHPRGFIERGATLKRQCAD
jgi:hypothetical protein